MQQDSPRNVATHIQPEDLEPGGKCSTLPNLSEAQQQLIALNKYKFEFIDPFYDEYQKAVEAVIAEIGTDAYFQDDEGVVYKTIVPEGTFVAFKRFDVKRTRREGEKSTNVLSIKEAEEKGFTPFKAPKEAPKAAPAAEKQPEGQETPKPTTQDLLDMAKTDELDRYAGIGTPQGE